ncbi:MAG: CT583 family protein [Chlamydiota bacterium]|nr:CT583 family protein [Chlamydiota bacterium]
MPPPIKERFQKAESKGIKALMERKSPPAFILPQELTRESGEALHLLLKEYATPDAREEDLSDLSQITAEIHSLNTQAILLHGERIEKAQILLKRYLDGAFSSWLKATYGNRQTPYNFLHYTLLHRQLPPPLKREMEAMPKQVIYTLSSRNISHEEKIAFLEKSRGKEKKALLFQLRERFPLNAGDEREGSPSLQFDKHLRALESLVSRTHCPDLLTQFHERAQQLLAVIARGRRPPRH